jgi:hypothetical protein
MTAYVILCHKEFDFLIHFVEYFGTSIRYCAQDALAIVQQGRDVAAHAGEYP